MLPFGSSPLSHFSNPSSLHKLEVNSSFISESGVFLLNLQRPSFLLVAPASTADLETCPHTWATHLQSMLLLPCGSLHPPTPPSLLKDAPPAALCVLTLASLCIRCATPCQSSAALRDLAGSGRH